MYKNRLKSFAKCISLPHLRKPRHQPPPGNAGIHLVFTHGNTSATAIPPLQPSWDCCSRPLLTACKPVFIALLYGVLFSTVINAIIKGTGVFLFMVLLWFYASFAPVFTALYCSLWDISALHSGVACTGPHLPEAELQRWRGHSRVSLELCFS